MRLQPAGPTLSVYFVRTSVSSKSWAPPVKAWNTGVTFTFPFRCDFEFRVSFVLCIVDNWRNGRNPAVQILNTSVTASLRRGTALRLNLGSGQRRLEGYFNVDCTTVTQPDLLADLNEPLDCLPDNCVEAVYARHTLEHIENFIGLLGELHRVCRADATLDIIVPHFSNPYGFSDPTHVRFFGLYSFFYFADAQDQPRRKVPSFYTPMRFRVEKVEFRLLKESLLEKCARSALEPLINRSVRGLDWYERRMCRLFPVGDVRYLLKPVKTVTAIRKAA